MKLLIIHLSDLHFENTKQTHSINIARMMEAISSRQAADECVVVLSGDLAAKGVKDNYNYVKGFVSALLRSLNGAGYKNKTIHILSVPGNHDINFQGWDVTISDIIEAYKNEKVAQLEKAYIDSMKDYFLYASEQECFIDDKVISKKIIEYGKKKVGFVLYNTAPLSLLGGNSEDMGNHYLSDVEFQKLEEATDADINILVLHHSIEWLKTSYKDKLRKIIAKKYSLVLSGHEHSPVGQSNLIDNNGVVQFVQGNALHGYAEEGNGFCTLTIELNDFYVEGYSYIWKDTFYLPEKIIDTKIQNGLSGDIILQTEFIERLIYDSCKRKIDNYYVFPGVTYNMLDENENVQRFDVDEEQKLFDFLNGRVRTVITGKHKSGKTLLAKRIFKYFYDKGKKPLLIEASDINKKKIERTIDYVFPEEYYTDDFAYEKYKQLDRSQRVAIIDEANLLSPQTLDTLVTFLESHMGQIILFSEDDIVLNVRKQVVQTLVDKNDLTLNIKAFLYDKRKFLINNILKNTEKDYDVETETEKINDLINMQVKYFNLDPEFIISFVNQYEMDVNFKFTAGMNVFNVVYESTIKNQIIVNAEEIDPTLVINILRELAYKMHFGRNSVVKIETISEVIETYKKDYRQKVNIKTFLEAVLNAKILIENDNEYRFKDHDAGVKT